MGAQRHRRVRPVANCGTAAVNGKLPPGRFSGNLIADGSNNLNQRYEIGNPKSPEARPAIAPGCDHGQSGESFRRP